MKSPLTPFFFGLFFAFNAQAGIDEKEVAQCAAISGDLSRLECFDELAKRHYLDGPQEKPVEVTDTGEWDVKVSVNPIDDSKTVRLLLVAQSGRSSWRGPVTLIARCKSGETDVFIMWRDFLGSDNPRVLTRIGKQKALETTWSLSTDSTATFHTNPVVFLKRILWETAESTSLVAQTTPYNENPVTAIWDTSGLVNAIKPLRETCNW
jgi:type VI secretion system protein VasI